MSTPEVRLLIPPNATADEVDLRQGIADLKDNAEWVDYFCREVDRSYRGLYYQARLAAYSAITAPLKPKPYGLKAIRTKLHLLLLGAAGSGKGLIMDLMESLSPGAANFGVSTSASLQGTLTKGNWTPGAAYESRDRLLLIRELFQTTRHGEHYENLTLDLNEVLEYPHRVTKRLVTNPLAPQQIRLLNRFYPDVRFARTMFEYEAPLALIAGTWITNIREFRNRVTEGFLDRFLPVPIHFGSDDAITAVRNMWDRLAAPQGSEQSSSLEYFRRIFKALYWTSTEFAKVVGYKPIERIDLPTQQARLLKEESERAMREADEQVRSKLGKQSFQPPLLFRDFQDVFRVALADAVSRRFTDTETQPGVITIDEPATETALKFLPMMRQNAVWLTLEVLHPSQVPTVPDTPTFWDAYRIIEEMGCHGVSNEGFEGVCRYYGIAKERAQDRLKRLVDEGLVVKENGRLMAALHKRMEQWHSQQNLC